MKKRVLFVIPPEKFRDEELFEPTRVLEEAGVEVVVASTRRGLVTGDLGGQTRVDTLLADVDPSTFGFVGVIGGSGTATHLWADADARAFVQRAAERTPRIGAICAGSVLLAKTGLLAGKRATTYPIDAFISGLREGGAIYEAEPVVASGNVITANGPDGAKAFGAAILAALAA